MNVVAPGAVSVWQAARLGDRVPIPLVGPEWRVVRYLADLAGAPIPDHLLELVQRGRAADGGRASGTLGIAPKRTARAAVESAQRAEPVAFRVVEGRAA